MRYQGLRQLCFEPVAHDLHDHRLRQCLSLHRLVNAPFALVLARRSFLVIGVRS